MKLTQKLFTVFNGKSNVKSLYVSYIFCFRAVGEENYTAYVKDAFHRFVVNGEKEAVSPKKHGTKVSAYYTITVPAGGQSVIRTRMYQRDHAPPGKDTFADFDQTFEARKKEADDFYLAVCLFLWRFMFVICRFLQ